MTKNIPDGKVSNAPAGLTHYVHHLLSEKGLSLADVERRAGGKISYSLIAGIAAGDFENVRWETLRALAKGLGVANERLFAISVGDEITEFQEDDFITLSGNYQNLSDEDKGEIDGLLQLLRCEMERLLYRQNPTAKRRLFPSNGKCFEVRNGESLKEYVTRILKEKCLTLQQVERQSQQSISAAYVCDILHGRTGNLTVKKIKALAAGLGVSPKEVFAVLEKPGVTDLLNYQGSIFVDLYQKYEALSPENKNSLRLFITLIDREVDRRQIHQVCCSNHHDYDAPK